MRRSALRRLILHRIFKTGFADPAKAFAPFASEGKKFVRASDTGFKILQRASVEISK